MQSIAVAVPLVGRGSGRAAGEDTPMPNASSRSTRQPETPTIPPPEGELFVYCKGCGKQLESRARLSKPKPVVDRMMCEECTRVHGHPLIPQPGAPTFCYRCGRREDTFIAPGISPTTHHVCPNCLPARHHRYGEGDFEEPPPEEEKEES